MFYNNSSFPVWQGTVILCKRYKSTLNVAVVANGVKFIYYLSG